MRPSPAVVFAVLVVAVSSFAGCTKAKNSKSADDPKTADVADSAAKPTPSPSPAVPGPTPAANPSPAKKPMPITVPVTASHKACYDSLEKAAAKLVAGFKTEVVKLANESGKPWDRLDKSLAKADELWGAYLNGGGSPRAVGKPWLCVVADLSEALVTASIDALDGAPKAERKARLDALEKIVDGRLADAPNNAGMSMAISAARAD